MCHSEPAGEESDTQCRPEAIAEGSQPLRSFGITLRMTAIAVIFFGLVPSE